MRALDIAEVAQRSGLPASALRHYEEKGLIQSIGRRGLRRLFEPAVVERLALIGAGRAAGFSLDELAGMFGEGPRPAIDRAMLAAKADEIELTIARLATVRDALRHAAACPAPSHMECPKFRRIVGAVTASARSGRRAAARPRPRLPRSY